MFFLQRYKRQHFNHSALRNANGKKVINDFLKTLKENVKQKGLPKGFSVKQGPVHYSTMLLKVFIGNWTFTLSKCVLQGSSSVSGKCLTCPESRFSSAGTEKLKGSLSECQKPVMKPAVRSWSLENPELNSRVTGIKFMWKILKKQPVQVTAGYIALCLKMEGMAIYHAAFPRHYITVYI